MATAVNSYDAFSVGTDIITTKTSALVTTGISTFTSKVHSAPSVYTKQWPKKEVTLLLAYTGTATDFELTLMTSPLMSSTLYYVNPTTHLLWTTPSYIGQDNLPFFALPQHHYQLTDKKNKDLSTTNTAKTIQQGVDNKSKRKRKRKRKRTKIQSRYLDATLCLR